METIDARIKRLEGAASNHQTSVVQLNNEITRLTTLIEANEGVGVEEALDAAKHGYQGLVEDLRRLSYRAEAAVSSSLSERIKIRVDFIRGRLDAALEDDLNIPKALGFIHLLISELNQNQELSREDITYGLELIFKIDTAVFGLKLQERSKKAPIPEGIEDFVWEREQARDVKDFARADALRKKIKDAGYQIDDTPQGSIVTPLGTVTK